MNFYISDDKDKLQVDRVIELLQATYWAAKRSDEMIRTSIENSICYGAYEEGTDKLLGFARVITDYATTYYLCDVIIDEAYRGHGIGKALVANVTSDERYTGMRALLLTKDAHDFYTQFGFEKEPVRLMWKNNE